MDSLSRLVSWSHWVGVVALCACGGEAGDPVKEQTRKTQEELINIGGAGVAGGGTAGLGSPNPCTGTFPEILGFSLTQPEIPLGASTTLSWQVQLPPRCGYYVTLDDQTVATQGSQVLQPVASTSFTLSVGYRGTIPASATIQVTVDLPMDPSDPTRNLVSITSQQMVPTLVQALGTPNTTVLIADGVQLDLSGLHDVALADGVRLLGGRSASPGTPYRPGPVVTMTTAADPLLVVSGNNVQISGLRLEGPGAVADLTTGIQIPIWGPAAASIEIDHNEIFNWNRAGIDIYHDNFATEPTSDSSGIIYPDPEPLHIHDNYIHDNWDGNHQHFGYGIATGGGGHALIERNVFNANWHGIACDATAESGYRAYRNLVLEMGYETPGAQYFEQQFDLHDRAAGGRDVDIRYNSFLFLGGPSINLRRTPYLMPYGAVVESNVFADQLLSDAVWWQGNGPIEGASCTWASSTCGPLDNKVGVTAWEHFGACDFDGDGLDDDFIATGQTLWYRSVAIDQGPTPWVYLNMSPKHLADLSLGYFRGTSVCDVVDNGWISAGGAGPWVPLVPFNGSGSSVGGGSVAGEASQ